MKKTLAALTIGLAFTSAQAQGLISYEGFAHPPYQIGLSVNTAPNDTANGSAWNGDWYNADGGSENNVITAGTLSYGALPVTDGHMNIIGSDRDSRKLPISLMGSLIDGGKVGGNNASGTLYLSFLMTVPTNPGFAALELHDGYGTDSNRQFDIRFTGSQFQANAGTAQANLGIDSGANFFVVKFQFNAGANNDVITVWRNPMLGLTDDPNGQVLTSTFSSQFTDLSIANFSGGNVLFDEIRLGETWAAVAIPEPSTYALIIGGALLLGIVIRRRNQTA